MNDCPRLTRDIRQEHLARLRDAVVDEDARLYPDTPARRALVDALQRGHHDTVTTAELIGYCGAHGAHCVCSRPPGHDGPHRCTDRTLWEGCFTGPAPQGDDG